MNHVILIGRLTKDPEKRSTSDGLSVCSFSLAVQRPFKNSEGNYDADFIPCVVYKVIADNVSVYCHKGSLVAVKGRLNTRKWEDQESKTHFVVEVLAEKVMFLDSKKKEHNAENDIETNTSVENDPYADMGDEIQLDESDLPFDFN